MIAVLDYESGNLRSVSKALECVGGQCVVTRDPAVVQQAEKLVVPGVGAFKDCMENLEKFSLIEPIKGFIQTGKPFLGICVGMQVLMEEGEEGGTTYPGLGIFPGRVVRFSESHDLKVPHMGWNTLHKTKTSKLLADIPEQTYVYFVHSYYVNPKKPKGLTAATTTYHHEFCSCLEKDNIFATQFHPEKSQEVGLKILKNFVRF